MKNILVLSGNGANNYIRTNLCNAWRAVGYNVFYWNPESKSTFDVFSEFPCDIFLGDTWQINRSIVKSLNSRPHVKIILYSDAYGDIQKDLDFQKYPVGVATDEQKNLVGQLQATPVLITNHSRDSIEYTHGCWRDLGCNVESVLTSADITQYYCRPQDENYKVQLFYCGGSWPYKNRNINTYLTPLLYPNTKDWKIRIAGGGWSTVQSIGLISVEEEARHYTNASVIPHVVEPHASDIYSDIPLRYTQTAACGGFAISCPCNGIREIFDESELVVADNPADFFEKVVYYLNNPNETISFREKARSRVLSEHTGFHRAKQLLEMVQEDTTTIDQIISQINFDMNGY